MSSARPSWTGNLRFGLLTIPVELINVCPDEDSPFVTVHAVDGGRLAQTKFCKKCLKPVNTGETVKAVEVDADTIALVTDEEIEQLTTACGPGGTIVVDQFPRVGELRLELIEKSYYLLPGKGANMQAFDAFAGGLRVTSQAAIGKIAFRGGRERLAAVVDGDAHLMLHVMRFPGELRDVHAAGPGTATPEMVQAAAKLIQEMAQRPVDLGRYVDEWSSNVAVLKEAKCGKPTIATGNVAEALAASTKRVRAAQRRKERKAA